MSVPYGAPPSAPRNPAPPPGEPAGGSDQTFILTAVAAGLGPVAYLFGFFDAQASAVFAGLTGFCLIAASTFAGLRLVPAPTRTPARPNTMLAAAPFSAFAALALAQGAVHGGPGVIAIIILLMAVVQLAAVAAVLLSEAGVVALPGGKKPTPDKGGGLGAPSAPARSGHSAPGPQGQPFPRPPQGGGWNPPPGQVPPGQLPPGPAPAQPGAWGNPHPGGPQQGGWNPQSGGFSAEHGSASSSQSGQLDGLTSQSGSFAVSEPSESGQGEKTASPEQFGTPASGQFGQGSQGGQGSNSQSAGPEGTRQMQHPGVGNHTPPRGF
jgi:hypothetical protein